MGVLGSSAISTVRQTTRLGKSNSVMVWDKCMPLRSGWMRVLSSGY